MTPAIRVAASGGILAAIAGLGLLTWRLLTNEMHTIKDIEPDALPASPSQGRTGWKKVDALLGKLRDIAQRTSIPLGLMVGWLCKESGGRLAVKPQPGLGDTGLDERGYFQLHPDESKSLGLDHQRLSVDPDYSLDAGVKLIRKYQSNVNDLDIPNAAAGNSYYWRLVKLGHSMGSGQLRKVVKAAKEAEQVGSWDQLKDFALGLHITGPQPKKWFPLVDEVYRIGKPFGFGSEPVTVAGYVGCCGFDLLGVEDA